MQLCKTEIIADISNEMRNVWQNATLSLLSRGYSW